MKKPRQDHASAGSRLSFLIFLILIYLVPPLLIVAGIIPFSFRFPLLLITTAAVSLWVAGRRSSPSLLGFRLDTLKKSLIFNLSVTIFALFVITSLYFLGLVRAPTVPSWRWFFIFYVLLSCPAQEFLFRSVLFAEMERARIESKFLQITISALAYCFLHVIYKDAITMSVTLLMGIIWGIGYYSYRNFWGVTVSHCILGTVSIFVGLI